MTMRLIAALIGVGLLGACSMAPTPADYQAIVAAPDRTDADRKTDERRKPDQLLAFTGVRPGMRVLDMGAAAGYSTELMARAVGPSGSVWAQDSTDVPDRAKQAFAARLKSPVMANVSHVEQPFDNPIPPGVRDLDLITFFFFYHDTTYMNVDRAKMDAALFTALKPGGVLVIADHSARVGDGATVGKTFHRIEESTVKREVEAAGFRLVGEGNFMRNPEDPRNTLVFRSPVPVDEFVLKFEKP
ncbi:MAG: class I SAM-dependent methyltransferase [Alphaproteobacteria bacterium]|nr:class I SAM-dependent methyltransferase [Alphaproteobacteria bacterium]